MNKDDKNMIDETSPKFLLRLIIVLTVICVVIACLLAAVNAITKDKIAENNMKAKSEAIASIFENSTSKPYGDAADGDEIYLVYSADGKPAGYCVTVKSAGFGGDIEMMVGIDLDGNTAGVKIVSMSETPGVGEKTKTTPSFLEQFIGKTSSEGFDAISGATISSKAVAAGVDMAHSVKIDLDSAFGGESGQHDTSEDTSTSAESSDTPETSDEGSEPLEEPESVSPETLPTEESSSTEAPTPETPDEYIDYPEEMGGDPVTGYDLYKESATATGVFEIPYESTKEGD